MAKKTLNIPLNINEFDDFKYITSILLTNKNLEQFANIPIISYTKEELHYYKSNYDLLKYNSKLLNKIKHSVLLRWNFYSFSLIETNTKPLTITSNPLFFNKWGWRKILFLVKQPLYYALFNFYKIVVSPYDVRQRLTLNFFLEYSILYYSIPFTNLNFFLPLNQTFIDSKLAKTLSFKKPGTNPDKIHYWWFWWSIPKTTLFRAISKIDYLNCDLIFWKTLPIKIVINPVLLNIFLKTNIVEEINKKKTPSAPSETFWLLILILKLLTVWIDFTLNLNTYFFLIFLLLLFNFTAKKIVNNFSFLTFLFLPFFKKFAFKLFYFLNIFGKSIFIWKQYNFSNKNTTFFLFFGWERFFKSFIFWNNLKNAYFHTRLGFAWTFDSNTTLSLPFSRISYLWNKLLAKSENYFSAKTLNKFKSLSFFSLQNSNISFQYLYSNYKLFFLNFLKKSKNSFFLATHWLKYLFFFFKKNKYVPWLINSNALNFHLNYVYLFNNFYFFTTQASISFFFTQDFQSFYNSSFFYKLVFKLNLKTFNLWKWMLPYYEIIFFKKLFKYWNNFFIFRKTYLIYKFYFFLSKQFEPNKIYKYTWWLKKSRFFNKNIFLEELFALTHEYILDDFDRVKELIRIKQLAEIWIIKLTDYLKYMWSINKDPGNIQYSPDFTHDHEFALTYKWGLELEFIWKVRFHTLKWFFGFVNFKVNKNYFRAKLEFLWTSVKKLQYSYMFWTSWLLWLSPVNLFLNKKTFYDLTQTNLATILASYWNIYWYHFQQINFFHEKFQYQNESSIRQLYQFLLLGFWRMGMKNIYNTYYKKRKLKRQMRLSKLVNKKTFNKFLLAYNWFSSTNCMFSSFNFYLFLYFRWINWSTSKQLETIGAQEEMQTFLKWFFRSFHLPTASSSYEQKLYAYTLQKLTLLISNKYQFSSFWLRRKFFKKNSWLLSEILTTSWFVDTFTLKNYLNEYNPLIFIFKKFEYKFFFLNNIEQNVPSLTRVITIPVEFGNIFINFFSEFFYQQFIEFFKNFPKLEKITTKFFLNNFSNGGLYKNFSSNNFSHTFFSFLNKKLIKNLTINKNNYSSLHFLISFTNYLLEQKTYCHFLNNFKFFLFSNNHVATFFTHWKNTLNFDLSVNIQSTEYFYIFLMDLIWQWQFFYKITLNFHYRLLEFLKDEFINTEFWKIFFSNYFLKNFISNFELIFCNFTYELIKHIVKK